MLFFFKDLLRPKGQRRPCCLHFKSNLKRLLCQFALYCLGLIVSIPQGYAFTQLSQSVSLEQILKELEQRGPYRFLFSLEDVEPFRDVPQVKKELSIQQNLDQVLAKTSLTYEVENRLIVIKPKVEERRKSQFDRYSGYVYDEAGEPLPGVSVKISGTTSGVATDVNGHFRMLQPLSGKPMKLELSFVGMLPQVITCYPAKEVKVIMHSNVQEMAEVVVDGYQVIDKRLLTSSVSTVKADDLEKVGVLTVDQMLEGKAPGLMITNLSATPGAAAKVRVRAGGTFTGSREPLWVVDGIIYEAPVPLSAAEINSFDRVNIIGNALTGINPQDIETINVLKDASATAIYGTRAANGVIVVTTKRGKRGKPSVTYSGSVGIVDRPYYSQMELMNSKERIDVSREIQQKNLHYPDVLYNPVGYEGALKDYYLGLTSFDEFQANVSEMETMNTDWFSELYRRAVNSTHSVNFSGGSDNIRYYFSVGYNSSVGAEKGVDLSRITARSNVDMDLRENMKIALSMSGSVQEAKYNHSSVNIFDEAYYNARTYPIYEDNGDPFFINKYMTSRNNKNYFGRYNILNEMDNSARNIDNKDFNLTANLNWDLFKGVKLTAGAGYRNTTNLTEEWITDQTFYVADLRTYDGVEDMIAEYVNNSSYVPFGGLYSGGMTSQSAYNAKVQLNLSKVLLAQHVFNLNLGFEANSNIYKGVNGWEAPGYNHEQGRSFIKLPRLSVDNQTGQTKDYDYVNMLRWMTDGGDRDIYPTIVDKTENRISTFLIFNYSFDNRYVLNFNMRSDGSNAFGQYEKYKFKPTWSVSGRWNVHNERIMKDNNSILEEFSVRGSYGFRGTSPSATPYMIISNYQHDAEYGENLAQLENFPNANLTWEKTSTVNLGLNQSWFKGRLTSSFDFAYSKSTDLILSRPVSLVNGQATQEYNGGEKEDYSYEVSLRGTVIDLKSFGWNFGGNLTFSKEKILAGYEVEGRTLNVNDYLNGSIYLTGFPLDAFYSYQFDRLNEEGLPTFKNLDAEGNTSEYFAEVLSYTGRRTPKFYGGFSTEFRIKRLNIGASFSYKFGQHIRRLALYDGQQNMPMPHENMSSEFNNRWRNPGDELHTTIPGLSNDPLLVKDNAPGVGHIDVRYEEIVPLGSSNGWFMYDKSDVRVVRGDHIRWQSLTVGYQIPTKWIKEIGLTNARISGQVSNLGFIAFDKNLKGQDPEQVQGVGLPTLPTYNFSLNVSF